MKRLLLATLPLALVAACGGGDNDSVASGGLSKADYVAQAEVLCAKANKDAEALTFPTSAAAISDYVGKIVEFADRATAGVSALAPPAADKADLESKVLTPLRAQVTEAKAYLEKIKAAVAKNDQAEIGKLISEPPVQTKADLEWMKGYGFKACVEAAETDQ